jgi:hypothetical protein
MSERKERREYRAGPDLVLRQRFFAAMARVRKAIAAVAC